MFCLLAFMVVKIPIFFYMIYNLLFQKIQKALHFTICLLWEIIELLGILELEGTFQELPWSLVIPSDWLVFLTWNLDSRGIRLSSQERSWAVCGRNIGIKTFEIGWGHCVCKSFLFGIQPSSCCTENCWVKYSNLVGEVFSVCWNSEL